MIGTDSRAAGIGNGSHGVLLEGGATNNTVKGTAVGAGNVISGNAGQGVRIDFLNTTGNVVAGNLIGTDAAGTGAIGNLSGGLAITNSAANNTIGGTVPGAGNVIAYNIGGDGINVAAAAGTGNAILGNSIHSNTGLGIDLVNDGVTANDTGDGDTGPNNLQNFPVLSAAVALGG
jgi:hypothetical protein